MTIEEVLAVEEMQVFDRKSVNIAPKVLAIPIIAFANADGGTVAIGISDKTRRIESVDYDIQKLNELLRVPFDFCVPTVKVEIEKVQCIDFKGRENHVLLMHIEQVWKYMRIRQMKCLCVLEINQKSSLLKNECS